MMDKWEENIIMKWIPKNVKTDNKTGKSIVSIANIKNLKLDPIKLKRLKELLRSYQIEIDYKTFTEDKVEEKITKDDRSPLVRDLDYGSVTSIEENKNDVPVYSDIEYNTKTNDIIREDYSALDKMLEKDFIPKNIKIKKKKDNETGDIDVFASIALFQIQRLKLSEDEIKHVIKFLGERDIQVFGKNSTLDSEFENYTYMNNYKHSELPDTVDWDIQLNWFTKYNELKNDVTKEKEAREIRNEIIKANMRLVPFVNYKFTMYYGFDIDELNSYGYEALIKAVERFDYTKGYKFSSYGYRCIQRNVLKNKAMEMGFYAFQKYNRVKQAIDSIKEFYDEMGFEKEISKDEVATLLEEAYGEKRSEAELSYDKYMLSSSESLDELDYEMDYDDDYYAELESDQLDDEELLRKNQTRRSFVNQELSIEEQGELSVTRDNLFKVLKTLTPREEKVITERFGLESGIPRTLEEVAKDFNVTRERIRQIEAKALRKLRHPSRSNCLRGTL